MRQSIISILEVVKKDLKVEARSKASLNQMILFALASSFLFSLSIDAEKFFAQILFLVILFSSILACSITVIREFDMETIEALKSMLSAQEIMVAKIFSNLLIILLLLSIITPICYALFNLSGNFLLLFLCLLISSFPISISITLLSPISAFAKGKEMLLPAMLFPVIFPIILPSMKLLNLAYVGIFDVFSALYLLSYSGLMATLSLLLSDHLF
ncbi:MAG: heme exporter protein CcmB [Archaeoglobaceae archaeon]